MASFQAKIGWKRMRKRKNKNYHSVPFPTRNIKFQKKSKKIKKMPLQLLFKQKYVGKG